MIHGQWSLQYLSDLVNGRIPMPTSSFNPAIIRCPIIQPNIFFDIPFKCELCNVAMTGSFLQSMEYNICDNCISQSNLT